MSWPIEDINGVAVVRMNSNPINRQSQQFFDDFHATFDHLEAEYSEHPIVLTSEGQTFSAGLDFDEVFTFLAHASADAGEEWFETYKAINIRVFTFPRPTIAAVNGSAIAGGLITALACDYRIAADVDAKFSLNEATIGIPMPSAYVELLKYAIGLSSTSISTLFGQMYSVKEALAVGFVHKVVSSEDLINTAVRLARSISNDALDALPFSKHAMQWETLTRINEQSPSLDRQAAKIIVSPKARRARAQTYERLKGVPAPWVKGAPNS